MTESAASAVTASGEAPLAEFAAELTEALQEANLPSLLAAMVQLTGDFSLLERFPTHRPRGPGDHDDGGLPPDAQAALRAEAVRVIMEHRRGTLPTVPPLTPAQVPQILGSCLGETIPAEDADMLAEELGAVDRQIPALDPAGLESVPSVLIIGAGFSGLCAAIRLGQAGVPYTVVEKNDEVGGTWEENIYPGCGVDTPVHLYSFSFAQRPDWPDFFADQRQVRDYLIDVADRHGIRERIQFGTELTSARWNDRAQHWEVTLTARDGSVSLTTAPVLISAVGLLNRPAYPHIPGLDGFCGPVVHTGAWDPQLDLAGKRIAVVGTGASAMQLVPAIAETAAEVTVFQRSAQWIMPNPNTTQGVSAAKRFLMAEVPWYLGWYRLRQAWFFGDRLYPMLRIDPEWPHPERSINAANERQRVFLTNYIESQLEGRPDLIAKCVPDYPPYGKRPLLDHGWFAALKRDNVCLYANGVAGVEGNTVVSTAGERADVDIVVLATGFQTLNMLAPMDIRGRSGASLRETWGPDDARALLGITVPDFPNLFILYGPNTNAGHGGSHVLSVEIQVRYVSQLIMRMAKERLTSLECRPESYVRYNEEIDAALAGSIWTHPGMTTYYRNAQGRIVTNIPWTNGEFWRRARTADPEDFVARAEADDELALQQESVV